VVEVDDRSSTGRRSKDPQERDDPTPVFWRPGVTERTTNEALRFLPESQAEML